jgi:hypothetical protein
MLVYLYIRIDFCQKSKEQRLKYTKNAYNVLKILTIIVILQNYFRKLSFLKKSLLENYKRKKLFQCYKLIFAVAAVENLAGAATCREGGGRAGSSYELKAAQNTQSKFFSYILDPLGGFKWKALEPSKFILCCL